MWPVIFAFARTYAPYIVWPAAAIVGVIGYNVEKLLDRKYPKAEKSILNEREERRLTEIINKDPTEVQHLEYKTELIFDKNAPNKR